MKDIAFQRSPGGLIMSRRTLLGTAMAAATLPLFAGRSMAQDAPKKGGVLRVAMGQANTAEGLDPGTYATSLSIAFAFCRGNGLTEYSAQDEIVPELAESWEASPDARIWTFKLRSGVTFHNGKALTSEDVVATYNYHRGEASTSGAKALLSDLKDVRADGDSTVIFELANGNADFPALTAGFALIILPSDGNGGVDIASGAGTGGYRIQSFEPGVRIELVRNPDYWKPDAAHFDEIHLIAVLDPAARNNAVISGQVDISERNDTSTLALLAQDERVIVDETPSAAHNNFAMACTMAPFTDANVRLAMKYGVDREDVLRKTQFGHGYVGNDHPIARSNKYFNTELEQTAYDPDKSRYYLKQAGLDSLDVELITSEGAGSGAVPAAELFSASAAAGGINITVKRVPGDGYFSDIWLKSPFAASDWGGRPTADLAFTVAYAKDAPWNETHWQNARFNELLVAARTELDEPKRKAMYWEMQEICNRDGGAIVLNFANWIVVRAKKVAHAEAISAQWPLDGYKAFERWWFA
jgi:peptide/nickel transport system substrate-binding protein